MNNAPTCPHDATVFKNDRGQEEIFCGHCATAWQNAQLVCWAVGHDPVYTQASGYMLQCRRCRQIVLR